MSVEFLGLEKVQKEFRRLRNDLKPKAMVRLATNVRTAVKRRVDKHTKPGGSGQLLKSLHMQKVGEGKWEIGHDLQEAHYAPHVHWGSKPHRIDIIDPKKTKALRWPSGTGSGTKFVFAKFVRRHPGYEGDPWLVRAADKAEGQLNKIATRLDREWR